MSIDKLPLLSEQSDRLAVGEWCDMQGIGVDVRMYGTALRLSGPLRTDVLRSAVTALVARHDGLRVAFPEYGRAGYQVIHPPREIELAEHDLRELAEEDRLTRGMRIVSEYASTNVDLDGGLLVRAVLVRLDSDSHLLGLAADHLVVDGEALEILVNELWALYAAGVRGVEPDLPEVTFGYRGFVEWEANWLAHDPEPKETIAEIGEYLSGIGVNPPVVVAGMRRETNQAYTMGWAKESLPVESAQRLSAYCRSARSTPAAVVLSAYLCALRACGSPTDIGVTIPTTRRVEPHLLDLVCALSSHATVRIELDPALSFHDLTRQVRAEMLEAHQFGQIPAPAVTAALAPDKLGRMYERPTAFFDVVDSTGWSGGRREIDGLVIEPAFEPVEWAVIESLSLFGVVTDNEITFRMFYPTDVFDKATISGLAGALRSILLRALADPSTTVGELVAGE